MLFIYKRPVIFTIISSYILATAVLASSAAPRYIHKEFRLSFHPRTPRQIQAFYEGRGFSTEALATLKDKCFITVGMKNTGKKVVWTDVSNWQFMVDDQRVKRYTRSDWKKHWSKLGVRPGLQATFRWTQFPIKLDFQPDEAEGGNVVISRTHKPITFRARFIIQDGNKRTPVNIKVEGLQCAFD